MKYACLVIFDGSKLDAMAPAEKAAFDRESFEYDQKLIREGHEIGAEALQSPDTAITVRVRDGKLSTTDGPYAETKEQLGGFILLEARDLNEAVRLAAGIPLARLGSIEVRPIFDLAAAVAEQPAAAEGGMA